MNQQSKRLEVLARMARLLNAEAKGSLPAKTVIDQMIARAVAKIDEMASEGDGPLEEICAKHGVPLVLFATSIRKEVGSPNDRHPIATLVQSAERTVIEGNAPKEFE